MTLSILKRLLRVWFKRKGLVAMAFFGASLGLMGSVASPLAVRAIIDESVRLRRPSALYPLIGLFVLVGVVKSAGIFLRKRFAGRAEVATEIALRGQLYDHVHALDMAYHERTPTGQLMSRASSDLQQVGNTLGAFPFFTASFSYLMIVSVILLIIDPPLGGTLLVILPVMTFIAVRFDRQLDPVIYSMQQHLGDLTSVAEETVTGIRVVKAFGREQQQVNKLATKADSVFHEAMKSVRLRAMMHPLFELLPALSLAAVLWFGGHRVLDGEMSPGTFVLFALYATQLVMPVRAAGWFASDIQQMLSAGRRIFEVLDVKPGIEDRPGAQTLDAKTGTLRFENVRYEPEEGRPVLDGFSLSVPSGTSVALVGPTGCGKSTLLRLILRFIEPTGGRVTIDDVDISEVTLHSLRAQIGIVFEETFLFSDTISSNIAFGRPDAPEDEIVRAAVLAQAHGFISDLPDGYDTVVGEQGFTLSGGQRQRIAIARAILMNPRLLLLDDATSSVDPEVEGEIRRGLAEAMRGRTTLIVARRPASAGLADKVVSMERGRIVAQGTHAELWASSPAYREVLSGTTLVTAP